MRLALPPNFFDPFPASLSSVFFPFLFSFHSPPPPPSPSVRYPSPHPHFRNPSLAQFFSLFLSWYLTLSIALPTPLKLVAFPLSPSLSSLSALERTHPSRHRCLCSSPPARPTLYSPDCVGFMKKETKNKKKMI